MHKNTYTTVIPKKILPKITLVGVPKQLDKENLIVKLVEKNEGLKSLIDKGSLCEVIYEKSNGENSKTFVLKCSPDIRALFLKNGGYVYIDLSCCRVYDRFYVVQCFHCQGFGHFVKDCQIAKSEVPATCRKCSGPHSVKDCKSTFVKCINCVRTKVGVKMDHPASAHDCPVMQYEKKMLESRTDYSLSKN
jgi:hypothetical protein